MCILPIKEKTKETLQWTHSKPTTEGAYWIRGNGLEDTFLIQVKMHEGELWCNLHTYTTELDFGYGFLITDLGSQFEWLGPLYPFTTPVLNTSDPSDKVMLMILRDALKDQALPDLHSAVAAVFRQRMELESLREVQKRDWK